ncbi:hypothetical protein ACSSS7_008042 [Eimeria intestinalis]
MVPASLRQSSLQENALHGFFDEQMNVQTLEEVWLSDDEFVLDPTRITLYTGNSGLDGDTFKELEMRRLLSSRRELEELQLQINRLVRDCPALPDFSGFHPLFAYTPRQGKAQYRKPAENPQREAASGHANDDAATEPATAAAAAAAAAAAGGEESSEGELEEEEEGCISLLRDGDVREPFYLSYDEENVEYFTLTEAKELIQKNNILVGSTFIIPYPPGFPIAVPGQILSEAIVDFMIKIDVKEIHGYDSKLGLRCFKSSLLRRLLKARGLPIPKGDYLHAAGEHEQEETTETNGEETRISSPSSPSSTSVPPVSVTSAD